MGICFPSQHMISVFFSFLGVDFRQSCGRRCRNQWICRLLYRDQWEIISSDPKSAGLVAFTSSTEKKRLSVGITSLFVLNIRSSPVFIAQVFLSQGSPARWNILCGPPYVFPLGYFDITYFFTCLLSYVKEHDKRNELAEFICHVLRPACSTQTLKPRYGQSPAAFFIRERDNSCLKLSLRCS